jgi:predicted Fe-Mo cluster-binding NifX family protein
MIKIAIPTDNKTAIAGHFGRTREFKVVGVEDRNVVNEEFRINDFTGHARDHHEHHHDHEHGQGQGHHSHADILNALHDCQVVIAHGMGRRAYDDLSAAGIKVFITREHLIEKAVTEYMEGTLDNNESGCCEH